MASPITNIRILKSPLLLDNKNQLTFKNSDEQFEFFENLEFLEVTDASYQRKDNIIRFPDHIDNIREFNYCMYQNANYLNKWFYAFITDMTYENDGMTLISISTDTFQTWQFDLIFKQSFIAREMVNVADDVQGKNLIDEKLELGEIIVNSSIEDDNLEPYFVIAYSGDYIEWQGTKTEIPQSGFLVNGIPSSIAYLICGGSTSFSAMVDIINECGMGDKIFTCFTVPQCCFESMYAPYVMNGATETNLPCCIISKGSYPNPEKEITFNKNNVLDNYTPRNKKLLNYPYNYIGFTALNGEKKIYRFEDFEGNPTFKILSELNPNPSILYRPLNYRKSANGLNDVVSLSGYPTLAYKNDYYNTWLAQNSNIIKLSMLQEQTNYEAGLVGQGVQAFNSALDTATGFATAKKSTQGKIGAGVGLVSGITNAVAQGVNMGASVVNHEIYIQQQMAQKEKQKLLPDTITLGTSATLIGYNLLDKNVFSIFTIKREFAERIDKFFDMYGYTTNEVKIPNLKNRPNWNYVKTIGANILGNIPQADLQIIKNIFDNGVTLWHKPETFLDYSQNNR